MERCGRKRKAPRARVPVPTKRMEVAAAESLLQLSFSSASTVQVVADAKNAVDVLLQTEFDAQHTFTQTVVLLKLLVPKLKLVAWSKQHKRMNIVRKRFD